MSEQNLDKKVNSPIRFRVSNAVLRYSIKTPTPWRDTALTLLGTPLTLQRHSSGQKTGIYFTTHIWIFSKSP